MGYLEENLLSQDSFSKTISSIKGFKKLPPKKEVSVEIDDECGIFDMKSDFDIITGSASDSFFDAFKRNSKSVQDMAEKLELERDKLFFAKQLENL